MAMPDLEDVSREKLLLHHFIAGLPDPYARQLRVIPEIKTLADALCRAQLLMGCNQDPAIREPETAAAVAEPTRLEKLEEQIEKLSERLVSCSNRILDSRRMPSGL